MHTTLTGKRAIVIGGSMAGLLTARVLATHFAQVDLVEKDLLPDEPKPRKGVPQGQHPHVLLAQGRLTLETYYPGLTQELIDRGAIPGDIGESVRWFHLGGYKKTFTSGLKGLLMSRPLLEAEVRRRTLQLPNISLRSGYAVRELLTDTSHTVTGVSLEPIEKTGSPKRLDATRSGAAPERADLVVDASGRGSACLRWLEALGYAPPPEEAINIDLSYATRIYRRPESHSAEPLAYAISSEPPHSKRAGLIVPVEGNRWMVTLSGMSGDACPLDEAGFLAFAQSLGAPDIYEQIRRAEPLSTVQRYRFPSSRRRHFEQLQTFPEGFLVIGDAVCSFNPLFGQGMTSAILQAQVLDGCLRNRTTLKGLWKPYFNRINQIVTIPWQAVASEDFRYPEVQGRRPAIWALQNSYAEAIHRTSHRDTVVYHAFLEVMNLIRPPQSLLRPAILWRIIRQKIGNSL